MAVNKRKILENAQKYLQKGSLDKALKEYRTLLELDPRDSSARLKLGDIHLRLGEKDEAVAAYLKVAQQFMKDGFDPKAVALFKQIAKLAPEQIDIYVPLAELYQRLGLTSEAMSALQTATEAFQKAGRKREALELLRKAASLDPTNTTSRLKIADLLRQQGMSDEALNEYDEVAAELERSGEHEALASVYERVLEIDPGRVTVVLALAHVCMKTGDHPRARQLAEQGAAARPDSIEALELHVECLQAVEASDEETEPVYRRLADLHLARGNEGRAREILQRFVATYEMSEAEATDLGVSAPSDPPLEDGELQDLTHAASELSFSSAPSEQSQETAADAAAPPAPAGDIDVEQVLAESSVYLRFGKRDKGIAGLEAILGREPGHEAALEKLTDALVEDGKSARAVELLVRGVESLCTAAEPGPAGRLLLRLGELDAAAADRLGAAVASAEAAGGAYERPDEPGEESFDDVDSLVGDGASEAARDEADAAQLEDSSADDMDAAPSEAPFDVEVKFSETGELEVPVDLGNSGGGLQVDTEATTGSEIAPEMEAETGSEIALDTEATTGSEIALDTEATTGSEIALDTEADTAAEIDLSPEVDGEVGISAEPDVQEQSGVPSADDLSASFESRVESEQAESETAEPVSEVSFAESDTHDATGAGDAFSESGAQASEFTTHSDAEEASSPEAPEAFAGEGVEEAAQTPSVAASPKQILEDLEEADFYYQQGLLEDAETVYKRILEAAPTNPQALLRLGEIAASRGEDPGEARQSEPLEPTHDFHSAEEGAAADEAGDALGDDLADWDEPSETMPPAAAGPSLEAEAESELAELEGEPGHEAGDFEAQPESAPMSLDEEAADTEEPISVDGETPIDDVAGDPAPGTPPEGREISHFDLAAELSDALRMEDTVAALPEAAAEAEAQPAASAAGTEDSLEAIFSEFKQGVRKQLTAADHETHYDLGIAYREMGLLEDALGEFRVAMGSPDRRLDSLHLMGLCARDLKRYQDAINFFCQALADGEPSDERRAAIDFDLGIALEESGDAEGATRVFEGVKELAPEFPGLAERMEALRAMDKLSPSESEASADTEEPPAEVFESFDDLIADAKAADVAEESNRSEAEAADEETVQAALQEASEAEAGDLESIAEPTGVADETVAEAASIGGEVIAEAQGGIDEDRAEAPEADEVPEAGEATAAPETIDEAAAPSAPEEPDPPDTSPSKPSKPKRGKSSRRRKISFG